MKLLMQPPLLLSFTLLSSICFGSDQYPKNIKLLVLENLNTAQIRMVEVLKIEVEVFELSLLNWVESALSVNLSDNPRIASKQALKRIESNYHNIASKLRKVVKTQNLIEKFNIKVFPAAVVDNRFVFYGTDDLRLVIRKWRALQ